MDDVPDPTNRVLTLRGESMSFSVHAQGTTARHDRYLGIDPGLNRTGYAILERHPQGPRLIEGGVLRSTRENSLHHRVQELAQGLREVIDDCRPEIVALEQVFTHTQNPRTALMMAHARGGILLTLADADLPVVDYSPTQVKKLLTGSGRASKEQIQHAVKAELRLQAVLEPNDVADAAAMALCLYHSVKFAI